MRHSYGVDSETGRLRSVLVHRPGAELRRLTPRTPGHELFSGVPWARRAQEEHDLLTGVLRENGVEVLYLTELLQDSLEYPSARDEVIASALDAPGLGARLRGDLGRHLSGLDPEVLAQVVVAGLAAEEFRPGRGLVYGLLGRHEYVLDPLPGLVFARDASVWVDGTAVVANLDSGPRRREPALVRAIYRHHPLFAGAGCAHGPDAERLDGGDVLHLGPGVIAVGVGAATTAAAVESLSLTLIDQGLVHTVLAVPLTGLGPSARLDTVCTLVDTGTVLMAPALAYTLRAHSVSGGPDGLAVSPPKPLLEAAATAMDTGALTVISTGLDPPVTSAQQWDDGGNALALAPGVVVCQERTTSTNERLRAAGVEVIPLPGTELTGSRGGPRCMACPVARERTAGPGPGPEAERAPAVLAPLPPAPALRSGLVAAGPPTA